MVNNSCVKKKIIVLLDILLNHRSEENTITVNQIIEELSNRGISAERKSIYSDIRVLKECGYNVKCIKGRANKYYMWHNSLTKTEVSELITIFEKEIDINNIKREQIFSKLKSLID